jgi:hypothetical protein
MELERNVSGGKPSGKDQFNPRSKRSFYKYTRSRYGWVFGLRKREFFLLKIRGIAQRSEDCQFNEFIACTETECHMSLRSGFVLTL